MNFWEQLEKPIFALAPMADVTDAAFREMFATYGAPDVFWTEFVSADGLFLAPEESDRSIELPEKLREIAVKHGVAPDNPLLKDLIFSSDEHPIVAQFFSRDPERMKKAAALAVDLGFDGVDINMGCPARVIVKQGAGCAMIREPEVAREVIAATKEGANGQIPVTVKTRIGFNRNELDSWLPEILREEPAVVSMHARTRKDMSKVPAKWDTIKKSVEIRDEVGSDALILGNGDVESLLEGIERVKETGCDGVMVGRGIFGDPTFFAKKSEIRADFKSSDLKEEEVYNPKRGIEERLNQLVEHSRLFEKYLGDTKSFAVMRKHFKAYVSGFEDASTLRGELMQAKDSEEVKTVVERYLKY
ncbi:MAG: tRNA-dihydrouridine synthase [Candidatus Paceibacterota bacterium]